MSGGVSEARGALAQAIAQGRLHTALLLAGDGPGPRELAAWLCRAVVCEHPEIAPCGECASCRRSAPGDEPPVEIDGSGKSGPLYRHVGDHPDLLWVERGEGDTRVRIGQIRALQDAVRLRPVEGGNRAAVIADAEWLNQEAQNALLRTLEEPPPRTHFVLVTRSPAGLLATVRSRCQRVSLPAPRRIPPQAGAAPDEEQALARRLAAIPGQSVPELLDWAEEFRGARAIAAAAAGEWLEASAAWLHHAVCENAKAGRAAPDATLRAWDALQQGRKALAQRNANPQMVVERSLLALRDGLAGLPLEDPAG